MKRITTLFALLMALMVAGTTSAFAWHVNTDKDQQTAERTEPSVTVREIGPAGDPFHRIVIKVGESEVIYGECTGRVSVPNEQWAKGTTFYVKGDNGFDTPIKPGESARLTEGNYTGYWSNSKEKEKFTISCIPAEEPEATDVRVRWTFIGRDGKQNRVKHVSEGCTFRTGWNWHKGDSRATVRSGGVTLLRYRAGAPGFYGPLYRGFTPGESCQ